MRETKTGFGAKGAYAQEGGLEPEDDSDEGDEEDEEGIDQDDEEDEQSDHNF